MLFNFSRGEIREGDQLPGYRLEDENGRQVKLNGFRGKWLVLYFYPNDDTPGCTREAITFSQYLEEFKQSKAEVFGISTDKLKNHRKFREKHGIKVSLLSDNRGKLAKAFGIKILFGMCSRDTVLISPGGKVEKIYRNVHPSKIPVKILETIQARSGTGQAG